MSVRDEYTIAMGAARKLARAKALLSEALTELHEARAASDDDTEHPERLDDAIHNAAEAYATASQAHCDALDFAC